MSQWKVTSQKKILETELFDVKEIALENNLGIEKIHHEAERAPVVSVFPLTKKNEIYLISQYRQMLKKTVLEAVAGYVQKNETTMAAAKRELKEETGIQAERLEEIANVQLAGSVFKSQVRLFLAKELVIGKNSPDDFEEIEIVKMPLKKAVEKVMLGEINHAASMIGVLILDKLRTQKRL